MGVMEVCMRTALFVLVFTAFAATAGAQESTPCHPVSPTERVVVTTSAGKTIRGTLLCLTESELLLTGDGQTTRTSLDTVRRIVTTPDPVWDGAAKGAVIPLVIWAVFCHGCEPEYFLRSALAYSLIGVSLDALDSNRKTLYRGSDRTASVAWRFRF
jgi:hypothetical protein